MTEGFGEAARRWRPYLLQWGLASAGVAAATASVIFFVGLVGLAGSQVRQRLLSSGSQVVFISSKAAVELNSRRPPAPFTFNDAVAIRRLATGVSRVTPVFRAGAMVTACGSARFVTLIGAQPGQESLEGWELGQGRFLNSPDERGARVAILGASVLRSARCLDVGRSDLLLNGRPVRVVGSFRPRGAPGQTDVDNVVYVPMALAEQMVQVREQNVAATAVIAADASPVLVVEAIRRVLRSRHGIGPGEPDDFSLVTQDSLIETLTDVTQLLETGLFTVMSWGFLVAAIGVMNSVGTGVLQRTSEIGLRRAVGATRRSIRIQFLSEAAVISVAGAAMGAVAGAGAIAIIARSLDVSTPDLGPAVAAAVLANLACGLAAGVWPASWAARISPVDALRHE